MSKEIDIPIQISLPDEPIEEALKRQYKNGLGYGSNVYIDAYVRIRKDESDES